MKHLVLTAALLALAGCEAAPPESTAHTPSGFKVARLFTHEGCSVYRFHDYGHQRYFTDCSGSTAYQTSNGKSSFADGVAGGSR